MFTEPDAWSGGSIELLVPLGSSTPERLLHALEVVWCWVALSGPYECPDIEPGLQAVIPPVLEGRLYGVAALPDGNGQVAFSTPIVEDDDGFWLYAGVPLGSLGTVYPVEGFPFGDGFSPWQHEVYAWLYGLAQHLFRQVRFEHGEIGWLTIVEVDELARGALPERRYHGYVVAEGEALRYYAPNQDGALLQ